MATPDAQLKISAAQQITADAVSTHCYDAGNVTPKRDIGQGRPLAALCCITAIGTTTGSAKLQVIQSATEGLGSGTQIIGEIDLATADIAAGKVYVIPISNGIPPLRFFGMNHDITGTVDYTVDAWIVPRETGATLAQGYARGYSFDIS
jgi:hypothetical protein